MTMAVNPSGKEVSASNSWKPVHYLGCAGALYMTTLASITIHELGHLLACFCCNVRATDFCVGKEFSSKMDPKRVAILNKMVYRKTIWYNCQPIEVFFNPLNCLRGHVTHVRTNSIRKCLFISVAGPLLEASVMTPLFIYTGRRMRKDREAKNMPNPFLAGVRLGSCIGILSAFLNMLPQIKGSDGYQFFQELEAIQSQRILN